MNFGFQYTIPARIAWFVQELPSFIIPVYYAIGCQSIAGGVVLAAFLIHYFNRQGDVRLSVPVKIWKWNSVVHLSLRGRVLFLEWIHSASYPLFQLDMLYLGMALFATGMYINIQSDSILRNLRKPGEAGYKIPRGGMFEYVSGANFFGEIVEWFGYALMSGSLPAIAFAMFTASNIGPRAVHHHRWYHEKFPDYPKSRKALIPFLL
ncbi:unnamed protein product [Nippostrongylus brasiliensis]|uniref:3-oxo-5-alpha-steroid 4-dehydrogenase 1 (inferred by orthology to a human protein) n=1 Tax=Nippostrongylus brasiliensis TaxID=27835 RepID=A0A0N4YBH8_NIPBR|nr:unnamed protein product [Nippostrongylus brasiliensis]